ncbi:MAG: rod-binding protein [Spirochaetes bacterium]|nr:rod-binding protein [Spirochaetota bacterium]
MINVQNTLVDNPMEKSVMDSAQRTASKGNPRGAERERLKKVAGEMESIFVKKMLDAMRASVHKEKFIDGGMAEDIFQDMLYDKYAETMSKTKSFGIADMITKQLERYI